MALDQNGQPIRMFTEAEVLYRAQTEYPRDGHFAGGVPMFLQIAALLNYWDPETAWGAWILSLRCLSMPITGLQMTLINIVQRRHPLVPLNREGLLVTAFDATALRRTPTYPAAYTTLSAEDQQRYIAAYTATCASNLDAVRVFLEQHY